MNPFAVVNDTHTQQRPICVSVNPVIVAQPTTFRRCFNLKKADLVGFAADLDSNIEEVDAIPQNYERFGKTLPMASRKYILNDCAGILVCSRFLCVCLLCRKICSYRMLQLVFAQGEPFGRTHCYGVVYCICIGFGMQSRPFL